MGRYGVDRPRVLELLKSGYQSGQIASELGCASSTITKIKQEFRACGVTWDGDEGEEQLDELDVGEEGQPIGWPGPKPPAVVEQDPEIVDARKRTALKQAELADLKVEQQLGRIRLELEGKPVPNQGVDFQRELLAALIAQQSKPQTPMFTPQVLSTLITAAVSAIQAFKQPPMDPLKMFAEFQKIIATTTGAGEAGVESDNMLGTVVRALAATKAPPNAYQPQVGGAAPTAGQPRTPDPRLQRNMAYLAMISRECQLGSDPAAIAGALSEGLGVLPEEFRRLLLEENLSTILSALPTLVPVQAAQEFQALAQDAKQRQWLEDFLLRLRERNRVGGLVEEAEPPQEAPVGYDLFPQADPNNHVTLPPDGPQLPPTG